MWTLNRLSEWYCSIATLRSNYFWTVKFSSSILTASTVYSEEKWKPFRAGALLSQKDLSPWKEWRRLVSSAPDKMVYPIFLWRSFFSLWLNVSAMFSLSSATPAEFCPMMKQILPWTMQLFGKKKLPFGPAIGGRKIVAMGSKGDEKSEMVTLFFGCPEAINPTRAHTLT